MPYRKSSWRCFAYRLRHCCISDGHWQSRQVEKVAAGHQVRGGGVWEDQNAWRALITYHRPLAKPDAAFGACLCGET